MSFVAVTGVIFDFDGTLFDSMHVWVEGPANYILSKGKTPHPTLCESIKTYLLHEAAAYMKDTYELSESVEAIVRECNDMLVDAYQTELLPKQGVVEFLQLLDERGVKMVVASATPRHHLIAALKRTNLLSYFVDVISVDDCGSGKDHPAIYEYACDILQTERSSTWVFEDAYHALRTAYTAGFPTVAVRDPYESATDKELMQYAHFICETLNEDLYQKIATF